MLVIGAGHSGCEIACICSDFADRVFLSSRHGAWIIPRILSVGVAWCVAKVYASTCYDFLPWK